MKINAMQPTMIGQTVTLETPFRFEPALLGEPPAALVDIATEVAVASATLGKALHPKTAAGLADLVRLMNCYYSNLIEGHHTRPRDIERALSGDLDADRSTRNLQREALAHIKVQVEIDRLEAAGQLPDPVSEQFIKWLHRAFYDGAPDEMLQIEGSGRSFVMAGGEWRSEPSHDVTVGRHVPPSSVHVADFMAAFADRYRASQFGASGAILAIPAAHHRFNFIHPFADGNGRVSRLMSHAMGYRANIAAHGMWSIARGLARGLESRQDYKRMMDYADAPRQGSRDGRGNLSEKALEEFSLWFLRVCLDQIQFMNGLFDIGSLERRMTALVIQSENLKPEAARLLSEALIRGEFERGAAGRITGLPERSARRVLKQTMTFGLLGASSEKGPVSLRFPVAHLDALFPRLFAQN
jgi:Fic family protein